jgi:ligand-binding sensor domain-containing protein/serine phosphatase RsbU (regulator of sigma subunit)
MIKKVIIYAVFLNLLTTALLSQQYFFRKYSIEEGLPQSSVFCLMQDARGYIWMGTDGGGVSRFDGKKSESFTKADGLSDNVVRSLLQDSKGNIWIGTNNGLTLYDGFSFTKIGRDKGFTGSAVMKIIESNDGYIWVATNDSGLFRITDSDSLSVLNYSTKDGLLNYFVFDIYEDSRRKLWVAMAGGVNIVEFNSGASGEIKSINRLSFDLPVDSTIILSIQPDSDGSVWLGTLGKGLFMAKVSPDGREYFVSPSMINRKIRGLTVWDILLRNEGEIWLATDKNGVIRLRNDKIAGRFDKNNGMPTNQIMNIIEDSENNCWFASLGQGAIMYDDEKFLGYRQNEGLTGSQVTTLVSDMENNLSVSTEEGVGHFKEEGEIIKKLEFLSSEEYFRGAGINTMIKKGSQILAGTSNGIKVIEGTRVSEFPANNELPDKKINCLLYDSRNILWIGTSGGFCRYSKNKLYPWSVDEGLIHNEVQTIIEDSNGRIWMGTVGGLVRLELKDQINYSDFNATDGLTTLWINCLAEDRAGNIWIGTFGGGIFRFDVKKDSVPISVIATKGILSSNNINSILFLNDSTVIAGTDRGFDILRLDDKQAIKLAVQYGIDDGFSGGENNANAIARDRDGYIWFGTKNGLVRFNPMIDENYHFAPSAIITRVKLLFMDVDWKSRGFHISRWLHIPENLILSYRENHITIEYTGFSFHNPGDLLFSYMLEPQSREWSPYSTGREIPFSGLAPGNYTFRVKAKNKFGITGKTAEFHFIIRPPFWKTNWFLFTSGGLFILILILYVRLRERNLIREKAKLEKTVSDRTREVVEQKDEIARQRDLVTSQKKEITDSINYAETIQLAVLPEEDLLKKTFSDYFILYMPKDIVSGDFYWMSRKKDTIVFTVADCTGHGVPGAFMSMLGVSFLNKIVNETGITEPSKILTSLRENIIGALNQKGSLKESKDGMDIAICSLDLKKMHLMFSGANNPLYLVRKVNNQYSLIVRKGDMMPVGIHSRMDRFTLHELDIHKDDTLYLFSDGFMDQFGGPDGRKFMRSRFIEMLLENQDSDMTGQKEIFGRVLRNWINFPSEHNKQAGQTDDIIILGIRI